MLELNIKCESLEEARVYLNAHQYHNLISDLYSALRNARKHGKPSDVLQVFDNFLPELCKAIDSIEGAY